MVCFVLFYLRFGGTSNRKISEICFKGCLQYLLYYNQILDEILEMCFTNTFVTQKRATSIFLFTRSETQSCTKKINIIKFQFHFSSFFHIVMNDSVVLLSAVMVKKLGGLHQFLFFQKLWLELTKIVYLSHHNLCRFLKLLLMSSSLSVSSFHNFNSSFSMFYLLWVKIT